MRFHKNSLRLAGLYLTIIMVISLFFSLVIYQTSTHELGRGLRGPEPGFQGGPESGLPLPTRLALRQEGEQRYELAKHHIVNNLVIINLLILVGAGVLSYYLAVRTLRPIEEANDAQSRFTADASHELRTPIAAMQSEIEVALLDPKLTLPQSKLLLNSNLEELAKLTALSEGLLKLAKNENGEFIMQDITLSSVVFPAVSQVAAMAKKKKITITNTVPNTLMVKGDSASLTELFSILLDNAIKYSPDKKQIHISAELKHKDVVVSVQDEGIGMKPEETQHIFDRFYRADTARAKQGDAGYGIGLSIAQKVVDVHGGTISVKSSPESGSTFIISLPQGK